MSPPPRLVRVEWDACGHPDRPNDRHHRARFFTSRHAAGEQVAALALWAPRYVELTGVWVTDCAWVPVDPGDLPVSDEAAERLDAMRASPTYQEMR